MSKGTFYGVGIGPGDPELLTLKAVRILERCPVIAAPRTKGGRMLALDIVGQAVGLDGKTILPLDFTMARGKEKQHAAHLIAAELVEKELANGRDVAMLNLGDVSIYATFTYIREILSARGYQAVMVPGVPSFCAVAARLGTSLTSGEEPLHILPATAPGMEDSLELPGTKVLMKSGRNVRQMAELLDNDGCMVVDCGLPTEAVYEDLSQAPDKPGYFATIIVKQKGVQ